ncbi:MAG: class I tRNA ligase family protein [Candidatus Shikimatogenerans bostrichidophilus]|nr:MAG: class I tRNA ligase family protein [Candidatus Shikimatogenerans bostrichidophilus]
MKYNFKKIENNIKKKYKKFNFFNINKKSKKKFYILNMFPYPSGSGLHVGHTIGYIFSDIIAKYKSSCGYKILNPIGFDSFGLPAEQYAIKNNKSPNKIIKKCIKNYKKQIKKINIFFNWEKEIITSKSNYYKWTQWIFIKLFNSWYDNKKKKARNIKVLIKKLINKKIKYKNKIIKWNKINYKKKNKILNNFRLIFLKKSYVNWCPKLSTVLANEEIKNGKSIRGNYNIIIKKMLQWHIRIKVYSDRLLRDLKLLNWPKNIKNSQKKWIGKYYYYYSYLRINKKKIKIYFKKKKNLKNIKNIIINYPSSKANKFINNLKKKKIKKYIKKKINLNEKFKILIKTNILNEKKKKINIYISNYFNNNDININNTVIKTNSNNKFFFKRNNILLNIFKDFNIKKIYISKNKKKKKILKLKNIIFSRQRSWGEPIPIFYKKKIPFNINEKYLPIKLPYKKKYFKLKYYNKWSWDDNKKKIVYNKYLNEKKKIFKLDTNTMSSIAGSNWYFIRYIDNKNKKKIIDKKKELFWKNVDLYIGGAEHTNGHLLYSRFCQKFLKDINILKYKEPFKKFINQGTILYKSISILKIKNKNIFISYDLIKKYKNKIKYKYIKNKYLKKKNELNIKKFKKKYKKYKFIKKKKFICYLKLEKMSKSKLNIINPIKIINQYGIDTFRLYQIFIGPFNKKKIWNIKNIKGIYKFLKRIWFYFKKNKKKIKNKKPLIIEKYYINDLIKKIKFNYLNLNLNTSISFFMITFNFFIKNKCINKIILEKFLIIFSAFAPFISEMIWFLLKNKNSIFYEKFPKLNIKYLKKKKIKYIIMINNKKKIIIYIKKKYNNKNYILYKLKNNIFFKKKIKKIKKIIFIKNKILNLLI